MSSSASVDMVVFLLQLVWEIRNSVNTVLLLLCLVIPMGRDLNFPLSNISKSKGSACSCWLCLEKRKRKKAAHCSFRFGCESAWRRWRKTPFSDCVESGHSTCSCYCCCAVDDSVAIHSLRLLVGVHGITFFKENSVEETGDFLNTLELCEDEQITYIYVILSIIIIIVEKYCCLI